MLKHTLLFCAFFAFCSAMDPGLRIRFGIEIFTGNNFFVAVPQTIDAAVSAGWDRVSRPHDGYVPSLVMYCHASKRLCLLYDDTGYIAGVQVGLPVSEISHAVYDFETLGFTLWTTSINGAPANVWTLQLFFVDNDFLSISPSERIANRDSSKLLQAGGVWLVGINKHLTFVSSSQSDMEKSQFTEQACIYAMGTHYYHNMSSALPCSKETIYPWFPMFQNGDMIGVGFMSFLVLPEDPDRDWFERPNEAAVRLIVPRGPECLYSMSTDPGVLTMHIYFVNRPYLMFC